MSFANPIIDAGVAGLCDLYANRAVTPVEACEAYLSRIDGLDGALGAYVAVDREGALAAAHESAERWQRGAARMAVRAGTRNLYRFDRDGPNRHAAEGPTLDGQLRTSAANRASADGNGASNRAAADRETKNDEPSGTPLSCQRRMSRTLGSHGIAPRKQALWPNPD